MRWRSRTAYSGPRISSAGWTSWSTTPASARSPRSPSSRLADVDRVLAVNVRGAYAATQAAVPLLSDGGRMIHLGSCAAGRVTSPGMTLYAMSKAALVGLSKGLARELGARGITSNVVQPGPIDTDMNPADGPFAAAQIGDLALDRFGTAGRGRRRDHLPGRAARRLRHRHRTDDRRRPHRLTVGGRRLASRGMKFSVTVGAVGAGRGSARARELARAVEDCGLGRAVPGGLSRLPGRRVPADVRSVDLSGGDGGGDRRGSGSVRR